MSLYLGNTVISGVATPIDGSIAIGQIISSIIPLTDAGLHLLDGALIPGGGIYDDFVQYIAGLSSSYPSCFTDEATWQNTVSSKGACGKFVYDSTNNTVRLPKITGFIEGTVDSNALGDLIDAGLPNITGYIRSDTYGSGGTITSTDGAFYTSEDNNPQNVAATGLSGANYYYKAYIDASRSSSIYGNSNTVQPQAIKVFYYIVIATTTKTDIEVDIDEIVTDLNSKADDNAVVHKTGNETIGGVKTFNNSIHFNSSVYIDAAAGYEGGEISFAKAPNSSLTANIYLDSWKNSMRIFGWDSNNVNHLVFNADIEENRVYVPTPTTSSNDNTAATTAYINNKFQVVSTLPASPDSNVFYFIPE